MPQGPPSVSFSLAPTGQQPVAAARAVRILIVDDSSVIRTLLRAVVSSDSRLAVIGTASDGASALRALDSTQPDLVLLDVEMPGMDGLTTLKQMRTGRRLIPVIMCSALTQRGAKVTIEALANGAADYVAKPSGQNSREAAMQVLAQDLIPKILALTAHVAAPNFPDSNASRSNAGTFGAIAPSGARLESPAGNVRPISSRGLFAGTVGLAPRNPRALSEGATVTVRPCRDASGGVGPTIVAAHRVADTRSSPLTPATLPGTSVTQPAVLLIGVSTGGPAALDSLLPSLAGDFPLPILVVQHMPELFTGMLADRLNERCALRVREAASGEPICRGTVYIARGDWHMEVASAAQTIRPVAVKGGRPLAVSAAATGTDRTEPAAMILLNRHPPENHCRPAVDCLFRSAAAVFGNRVLGVVLTGMGSDGLRGSRMIRERGGTILAQDQASSAVWGMPGAVVQAGLAQRVLPLSGMATEILRLASRGQREAYKLRESTVTP